MPSTSLRAHHPLDVDAVDDLLDGRQHLAGEFQLAEPERPSPARRAEPAEEEAEQLPQRIEAQAARHDRIAFEMAGEEPEVGLEIEHGAHQAFAVFAAGLGDLGDAVEHQHGRQRQLGIAGAEQFAAAAGQQVLVAEAAAPVRHSGPVRGRLVNTQSVELLT